MHTVWQRLFPNRFYIEVSRVGKATEQDYIPAAAKLAELVLSLSLRLTTYIFSNAKILKLMKPGFASRRV